MNEVQDRIDAYNSAEQVGRCQVPNIAIQAFGLEAFSSVGYPFRISHASELWRYHDVMQDGRLALNFDLLDSVGGLDDLKVVRQAATALVDFSHRRFGFASAGKDMLSRACYQYALLCRTLSTHPRPWTILEVGPGCGYLGLLLGLAGHRYIALEASQAMYVYQSSLFADVFADEYENGLSGSSNSRISHLAWWDFCSEGRALPRLTGATANHMIAEMNKLGLRHLLRRLHTSQSDGFQLLAESLGAQHVNSYIPVLQNVVEGGFAATETHATGVWVFTKTNGSRSISYLPVALRRKLRAKVSTYGLGDRILRVTDRLMNAAEKESEGGAPSLQSAIRKLFAEFPDLECADSRFKAGRW